MTCFLIFQKCKKLLFCSGFYLFLCLWTKIVWCYKRFPRISSALSWVGLGRRLSLVSSASRVKALLALASLRAKEPCALSLESSKWTHVFSNICQRNHNTSTMHIDNRVSSLEAARKFLSEYECVTINSPQHTVRNLHFLSENSTLIFQENSWFFGWKIRENVVVLDFLAVDNFDFTRKIVKKKIWGKNSWKRWGCQNQIFGQKFDFTNSVLG